MKALKKIASALCLILAVAFSRQAGAQFMPVVYDNNYGRDNQFTTATADFQNGDMVIAGVGGGSIILTWLDRTGESRFTTRFAPEEFSRITRIAAIDENRVLVVGRRNKGAREKESATGRAMVINVDGKVERTVTAGIEGTTITSGRIMPNGNMILSGSNTTATGRNGMICKVNSADKVVYTYVAATGEQCDWFDVQGSQTETISAAFSSVDREGSSVVRLDENGKPYFITVIPDPSYKIEKMLPGMENDLYLVGEGSQTGGAVIKIRQEGDIVFQKPIVPATSSAKLNQLIICPTGEILVGGNDASNAYFSLLRNDGTELSANIDNGIVSAMAVDPISSDCLVSLYNPTSGSGKIVKMTKQGHRLYEKMTAANYTAMFINMNGDLLLGSSQTGRLSMLSNLGELLFDRYVVENTPTQFADVYLPSTGEALFMGSESRVAKLAHGVYVSDITVNKPINGNVSAIFTVTVSGYSFSSEGAPFPVSVAYKTRPVTALEGVNFDAVAGTISFVPSADGSDRYLSKFTVEVPVNANDLFEGSRIFSLDLSDVKHSYLIKSSSTATIEDQPAVVELIGTTPGIEGEKDIVYELGIFKRDGTRLTNNTKSDIVIDGIYGNGTADRLDFNMGRIPRLVIEEGRHSGTFNVETIEDNRYEATKSVILNFNTIHAMSDTEISFGANQLSCQGTIDDQAAMIVIESLGDHIKRTNDVVNGLFKISLVSAKNNTLLTNISGADISITTKVSDGNTAEQGRDFVITNAHDLRISGDGRSSAVNLNGVVLYNSDPATKSVVVNLEDVKAGANAGSISISPARNTAQFSILNK